MSLIKRLRAFLDLVGSIGLFAARALRRAFLSPVEFTLILLQIEEVGWKSLPLVVSSGFAVGLVLTLHTRSTLVRFGAGSMIPSVQSIAFFAELGPLLAGLLAAGRVGAGIGAQLAGMRVNEEIDAIETFSFDSFTVLVVPRVLACVIALPILTVFTDAAGIAGGYLAESMAHSTSVRHYLSSAFSQIDWATFIPPTLKTAVFGFIIGLISSWYGFTATDGSEGVGRAATQSVVTSSLAIILADVILVKAIFFLFPGGAI
jgi:phospholipid/cholesterol/gamma-HCH transport system permease protein